MGFYFTTFYPPAFLIIKSLSPSDLSPFVELRDYRNLAEKNLPSSQARFGVRSCIYKQLIFIGGYN